MLKSGVILISAAIIFLCGLKQILPRKLRKSDEEIVIYRENPWVGVIMLIIGLYLGLQAIVILKGVVSLS